MKFFSGGLQYRKSIGSCCRDAQRFGRKVVQSNLNVLPKPDNSSHQLWHPFCLSRVNNPMDYVNFLIEKFFVFVGRLICVGLAFF